MKKNRFIAISGNIGAGKTTWTELLSERFHLKAYYEKVIENPYLDDFYREMKNWSFHSQIFFLTQRFKTHFEIQQDNIACIQDRTIYEDSEIFATNLYTRGLMSERDFKCYRDLYDSMISILRYPDLLIYLQSSVENLTNRIHKRARTCENQIETEYLRQLNLAYEQWVKKMEQFTKVLIIDTDELNIFEDNARLQSAIDSVGLIIEY